MKMDFELARRNMITQQVRGWDVYDDEILGLLNQLHREDFVPEAFKELALADIRTPLGEGETMLAPKEEGKILQALEVLPTETVLEIGTGSGYMTALLARLANHVYSIECHETLSALAKANLTRYKLSNVTLKTGNGATGWADNAPYDVIVVTGSVSSLDKVLSDQVNIDGRIFAFVGKAPNMQACLWTKRTKSCWDKKVLYETVVPCLHQAQTAATFEF